MSKVSLDIESFKALASETRLDILRVLDGKKMNLNEITKATKLHKMTLHEHLVILVFILDFLLSKIIVIEQNVNF